MARLITIGRSSELSDRGGLSHVRGSVVVIIGRSVRSCLIPNKLRR